MAVLLVGVTSANNGQLSLLDGRNNCVGVFRRLMLANEPTSSGMARNCPEIFAVFTNITEKGIGGIYEREKERDLKA
ncbi:hypothetical protein BX666DRAFT_1986786 [Dichotomocladium elegans]|nr:hypothetical protein BX666DRAFT_1986786 [Dichotomocladium elegans]